MTQAAYYLNAALEKKHEESQYLLSFALRNVAEAQRGIADLNRCRKRFKYL